ncbi:MAG TPA: DUF2240 family protein [Thermoplasmata archaeon]|nr:DUF2240 family protein [Thermoplasmata archaeon]
MEDLRKAIALLFRRKGRDAMSEKEFVLSASMDLRWFPPREAQKLLQRGLETKLLEANAGVLRTTFDVASVDVPRDFTPTPDLLEGSTPVSEDLFVRIVDAIASGTKSDRRNVIAAVNAIQERMDVELEVAALIAARKAGVDVARFLPEVEARLGLA